MRRPGPALALLLTALLLAALLLAGCGGGPAAGERTVVRVAAAADLTFALAELEEVLAEQHPEIELAVTSPMPELAPVTRATLPVRVPS